MSVARGANNRLREQRLVRRITHSWRVAKIDPARIVDLERLGHHVIAALEAPVRRIEWVFKKWRFGKPRGEMRIRGHAHAVRPRMRREYKVVLLRHDDDAAQARDAADERGIGLQHVHAAAAHEIAQLMNL